MKTQLKSLLWLLIAIAAITTAFAQKAPTAVSANAKSPSLIEVNWKNAATNQTGFDVQWGETTAYTTGSASKGKDDISHSISIGLKANTKYYIRVRAKTLTTQSSWVMDEATTPNNLPSVPKSLSADAVSVSQIDFSWNTGDGGSAPTSFDWQCSTDKTFAKTNAEGNTNQKSIPVSGLQTAILYYLRVQAKNAAAVSGWSAHIEKSTLDAAPAIPSIAGLNTAADGKSIKIDWKNNSARSMRALRRYTPPNPTSNNKLSYGTRVIIKQREVYFASTIPLLRP